MNLNVWPMAAVEKLAMVIVRKNMLKRIVLKDFICLEIIRLLVYLYC
jgi:hypothetical protein